MLNGIAIIIVLIVIVALTKGISIILETNLKESIGKNIGKNHFREMGINEEEKKDYKDTKKIE